ncbi:hypothetical protein [Bacillus sp. V3-13]|nr:hypothetical protein [Bacillus sp. V3-13]
MPGKKLMMTTIALGTAFLLRDKKSRQKLKEQFQAFSGRSGKSRF